MGFVVNCMCPVWGEWRVPSPHSPCSPPLSPPPPPHTHPSFSSTGLSKTFEYERWGLDEDQLCPQFSQLIHECCAPGRRAGKAAMRCSRARHINCGPRQCCGAQSSPSTLHSSFARNSPQNSMAVCYPSLHSTTQQNRTEQHCSAPSPWHGVHSAAGAWTVQCTIIGMQPTTKRWFGAAVPSLR